MFPLIKNFRATTIPKAFILNAIATALIAVLTIEARLYLDTDELGTFVEKYGGFILTERRKVVIAFITAFIVATITYSLLHFITGYGDGMLVNC